MLARDQSRIPPRRSIRFTSSPVNGAYFARHVQKSSASLSSAPAFADAVFPVARAAEAFQRMRENRNAGKILIAWGHD